MRNYNAFLGGMQLAGLPLTCPHHYFIGIASLRNSVAHRRDCTNWVTANAAIKGYGHTE
jgi:hypothetical protein